MILVGASRKRFLAGFYASTPPADLASSESSTDRDWATQGANAAAVLGGVGIIRVSPALRSFILHITNIACM